MGNGVMPKGAATATGEVQRPTDFADIDELRATFPGSEIEHELRLRVVALVPSIAALALLLHKQGLAVGALTARAGSDGGAITCRFFSGSDMPLEAVVDAVQRLDGINSVMIVTRLAAAPGEAL
jgi:hypothetical protein